MANPYVTANAQNTFLLETQGFVQGDFWDDPSAHMWLAGGVFNPLATVQIPAGFPIEKFPPAATSVSFGIGPQIQLAGTIAAITGWMVYNQAASMVTEVGANAPVAYPGNYVSYLRAGSKQVRVVVPCSTALVSANTGSNSVAQQLQWDFTNNVLIPFASGTALSALLLAVNTNSKIVTYNSTTGAATWTAGSAALIAI